VAQFPVAMRPGRWCFIPDVADSSRSVIPTAPALLPGIHPWVALIWISTLYCRVHWFNRIRRWRCRGFNLADHLPNRLGRSAWQPE